MEEFISRTQKDYNRQVAYLALISKFFLSLAIILRHQASSKKITTAYTPIISENFKSNENVQLSIEFFKLAVNFFILIIWSIVSVTLLSHKYNLWSSLAVLLLCLIIMTRWNSSEFLKNTFEILKSFLTLFQSESVTFSAILVADVLTSFAKPSAQLTGNLNFPIFSIIIYG